MTFGQVVILLTIGLMSAGSYYGVGYALSVVVPAHLKQIQEGYELIDKRQSERSAAAHAAFLERDKAWQAAIEKQWSKIEEKDNVIKDFLMKVTRG